MDGKSPNLYWNLEKAIEDALLYVEKVTERKVKYDVAKIIKEFDDEDGNTNQ